jgi:hypothetical protein
MNTMTHQRDGSGICPSGKPCSACGAGHGTLRIRLRPLKREAAMNTTTHVRAGEGPGLCPNGTPGHGGGSGGGSFGSG